MLSVDHAVMEGKGASSLSTTDDGPVSKAVVARKTMARSGVSKQHEDFVKMMERNRVGKAGRPATHTTMPLENTFPGTYSLTDDVLEEFFKSYCNEVYSKRPVSVIEKHLAFGPVLADFDMRYTHILGPRKRIYNIDFVKEVVSAYWMCIVKYIDVSLNPLANECYVTEKPEATFDESKNVFKDGLHFSFPNVITWPSVRHIIRYEVIEILQESVEALMLENPIEDLIDASIIDRNGWMMYGSRKQGKEPYGIYGEEGDDFYVSGVYLAGRTKQSTIQSQDGRHAKPGGSAFSINEIVRTLSIRRCNVSDIAPLTELGNQTKEMFEEEQKRIIVKKENHRQVNLISTYESYAYVAGLVELLDSSRADSYGQWFDVGCCLYNIDYRLLDAFIAFSARAPKYADIYEDSCRDLWARLTSGHYTIATLIMWVKSDNKVQFDEYQKQSLEFKIRGCCDAFCSKPEMEADSKTNVKKMKPPKLNTQNCLYYIGDLMCHLYALQYVCSSYQQREWFWYTNHRWERTEKGIMLRTKITSEMPKIFADWSAIFDARMKTINEAVDPIRKERQRRYSQCCMQFGDIVKQLQNRDIIMNNISESFYWRMRHLETVQKMVAAKILPKFPSQFDEILDSNIYLLGMNNGVYDLANHEFRDGRPDDYIMMNTCNDYVAFTLDHPLVLEVIEFISQILPCERVRVYVLLLMASFLDGHTGSEKFYIWSGCGGNGKSKLVELLRQSLGDYYAIMPVSLLTQKRASSNAASPELARMKGKRVGVMNEPNEGDKFSVGMLKELTGGDTVYARPMFKEGFDFKPTWEMILLTNHNPKVPANDEGTWRRLRLVQFESKFLDNPDTTKRNEKNYQVEFKRDNHLDKKMVNWKEPFFWLLTYYYKIFRLGDPTYQWVEEKNSDGSALRVGIEAGITEPEDVLEHTRKYRTSNDPYVKFMQKAIVTDPHGRVYLSDLFQIFTHARAKQKSPYQGNKTEFQEYLESSALGKMNLEGHHEGWKGHRLNDLDKIPDIGDFKEKDHLICFMED